jgi:hypothetical protein
MRGSEQTMDRTPGYLGLVPIGVLGWAADRLGGAPAMAARSAGSESVSAAGRRWSPACR